MDHSAKLAARTEFMQDSAIRELFKVIGQPGMISFAGGVPAPECLPIDLITELTEKAIAKHGPALLQYTITEGIPDLRDCVATLLADRGIQCCGEDIGISAGAQNAIDAAAKVLIDKEASVAVEEPTFLAALKTFAAYEPKFLSLKMDEDGVLPEAVEECLKSGPVRFIYIIPTFQNPTGRTLSLKRREEIADLIRRYDALVIEDDPYCDLRFEGEGLPALKSLAPDNVIYIGSFSKILSPGLRLGFYLAPEPIQSLMTSTRQGVDVHASMFGQGIAEIYLREGYFEKQLPKMCALYSGRRNAMLTALEEHFPDNFTWTHPEGGMFVWVEGPEGFDATELQKRGLAEKVAFVPGASFYARSGHGGGAFRLNFSAVDEEAISQGIRTIGKILKQ